MKDIFYTAYHVAVDDTLIQDLGACGCTVYMPNSNWEGKISFHRANDEFLKYPFVKLISYQDFLNLANITFLIPCTQLLADFQKLRSERFRDAVRVDEIILLSALSTSIADYPIHLTDFVMSHDIYYHRATEAKYKILYFSPPSMLVNQEKDIKKSFDEKQIKLYINNFTQAGFEPEYIQAKNFRELWIKKYDKMIPFYGENNEQGSLPRFSIQTNMLDSMFTFVPKRRETWGQMVNESMLLGTPCIFLKQFMNSTLKYYEITEDNSIIGDDVYEITERISRMSLEQYEVMSMEAKKTAMMFSDPVSRRYQLNWLLDKTV